MRKLFTFLSLFIVILCFSQKNIPRVKATSNKARIYEEDNRVSGWGINPKMKPDTHTTAKFTKRKKVMFKTDSDSIVENLKLGEKRFYCFVERERFLLYQNSGAST